MSSCPARWAGVSFAARRAPQDGTAVVVEELGGDVRLGVPAVVPAVVPEVVLVVEEAGLDGLLEVDVVPEPPPDPLVQPAASASTRAAAPAPRTGAGRCVEVT